MDPTFLNRNVNEGFSGGEKKRNEILQLAVLEVCPWLSFTTCWSASTNHHHGGVAEDMLQYP